MSEKQMVSPPLQYPKSKQAQCVFDNLTVDTEKGISLLILNRNKDLKMNTGLFHEPKCKFPSAGVKGVGLDWTPRRCHFYWY